MLYLALFLFAQIYQKLFQRHVLCVTILEYREIEQLKIRYANCCAKKKLRAVDEGF